MKGENLKSEMFRLSRMKCYFLMMMEHAPYTTLFLLIVLIGLTTAGFIVSPWYGVAALGFDAFLLVMAMSFVIFVYGFNSVTGANMAIHSLSLDEGGIMVEFEDCKCIKIPREDIGKYKIYPGGALLIVHGTRKGWIWIPPKAFEGCEISFETFLKGIYDSDLSVA